MSRVLQPASGEGFARPHVRKDVGAGRRMKRAGQSVEAGDVVAKARAPERPPSASL